MPVNSFAARFALVVIALVAVVWLAVGLRAVQLEQKANALMKAPRPLDPGKVEAALADLAEAGRFSPDQGPMISQGYLLLAARNAGRARAVAGRVTKEEPDNLQGWYLAWQAATPNSPAWRRAERRVLELNPWFEYLLLRRRVAADRQQHGR